MSRTVIAALVVLVATAVPTAAPETINHDVNARIRKEGRDNSQIMRTMHYLTDVYGPRLTGSPNHKAAAEWAVKQMTEWGFTNGHLEPWDFGRPGWLNERFSGFIVSPVKDSLVGEVLAWTPSTNGTVVADAMGITPPDRPTEAELSSWISETQPKIKGRIVLVGNRTIVPSPSSNRRCGGTTTSFGAQYDPNAAADQSQGRGGRGGRAGSPAPGRAPCQRGQRAHRCDARAGRRSSPPQRRRPRSRPDPGVQQPDVRHYEGRADGRPAQRRLRPDLAVAR